MVRFMRNIYFRAVAIALIISFITTDISWACPQCGTGNSSTLATQSIFQQNMITEAAEKYRGSILADSNLLGSVYSIARYLLGDADAGIDPLPIKYMEEMLTAELGSALNGIDLSKVTLTDGVAYIPFVKGDKKHILQIALKGNKSFMSLSGYEWPVFDKYVVKDLPEDYSHVSAAQPMTKSFPADSTPDASSGSGQTSPANPLSMKRIKPAGINDEYIQIKTAHKREVIIKNLSSVLKNGVPDSFVKDFVDGMPNEHLERAAIARLVNEIVFSYLMFKKHLASSDKNGRQVLMYNPDDSRHTEILVFAKDEPGVTNSVTGIFSSVSSSINIESSWSCNDRANGVTVEVFEVQNEAKLGLPAEIQNALKKAFAASPVVKYEAVEPESLMKLDPILAEGVRQAMAGINASMPREIEVPSMTGDDIMVLRVERVNSYVDSKTIIDEQLVTGKDTKRQRAAKIVASKQRLESAIANVLVNYDVDDDIMRAIIASERKAFERLEKEGKDALFSFLEDMKLYEMTLNDLGDLASKDLVGKILKEIVVYIDSESSLKSDNPAIEADRIRREHELLNRAANSIRSEIKKRISGASEETAIQLGFLIMGLDEKMPAFHKSIDESKRRVYIDILEYVKTSIGPKAKEFIQKMAGYYEEHENGDITEAQLVGKLKPLEGLVEAYSMFAELLRMVHNFGHSMPELVQYVESEKVEAVQAIDNIKANLTEPMKEQTAGFFDWATDRLTASIEPGGMFSSEIFNNLAEEYITANPGANADEIRYVSGLFTYAIEGRDVPSYMEEDQANVLYVTESMDQIHFYDLIGRNPKLAAIGTEQGNSRSHWVITAKDIIIPGREGGVIVMPGLTAFETLKTGDIVVIDCPGGRCIVNPQLSPKTINYYQGLMQRQRIMRSIFRKNSQGKAVTVDGARISLLSDVPRLDPDVSLVESNGSEGVGLFRTENMYDGAVEPSEEDIYNEAIKAASKVSGPVTLRTLDMAQDKLDQAMKSIRNSIYDEAKIKEREPIMGAPFYFESDKGQQIIRTQLRAFFRAYAIHKNIRILIPSVDNEIQAQAIRALIEQVKKELIDDGIDPYKLEGIKIGAMIESPGACLGAAEIVKAGKFDFISFGTNDLTNKSFDDKASRDDKKLESAQHVLFPAFLRNIDVAVSMIAELNKDLSPDKRVKIYTCGEWPKSRKFIYYIIGLMKKYNDRYKTDDGGQVVEIAPVTGDNYRAGIGRIKEYIRNISQKECYDAIKSGDINANLGALVGKVEERINEKYDVAGEVLKAVMSSQSSAVNAAAQNKPDTAEDLSAPDSPKRSGPSASLYSIDPFAAGFTLLAAAYLYSAVMDFIIAHPIISTALTISGIATTIIILILMNNGHAGINETAEQDAARSAEGTRGSYSDPYPGIKTDYFISPFHIGIISAVGFFFVLNAARIGIFNHTLSVTNLGLAIACVITVVCANARNEKHFKEIAERPDRFIKVTPLDEQLHIGQIRELVRESKFALEGIVYIDGAEDRVMSPGDRLLPYALREFEKNEKLAMLHGDGREHAWIRASALREIRAQMESDFCDYERLFTLLSDAGYEVKRIDYIKYRSNRDDRPSDIRQAPLDDIRRSVINFLKDKKEVSPKELFDKVCSTVPYYMKRLSKALSMIEPIALSVGISADEILARINEAKLEYGLSDQEARIISLALFGPGQGAGDVDAPDEGLDKKIKELFETVWSNVNNERTGFIATMSDLRDRLAKAGVAAERLPLRIDKSRPTVEITDMADRLISIVEGADKNSFPQDTIKEAAYLKTSRVSVEVDSIIASIIALAKSAKYKDDKLVIGIETGWIQGLRDPGGLESAIFSLVKEIKTLDARLKSLGLDNIIIVSKDRAELADELARTIETSHVSLSNVVVLASQETIGLPEFDRFKSAPDQKRAFFAAIDTSEMQGYYLEHADSTMQIDVKLVEMLSIALELAVGKEPPMLPYVISYDKTLRIVVFLPKAQPLDYDELNNKYNRQKEALRAA